MKVASILSRFRSAYVAADNAAASASSAAPPTEESGDGMAEQLPDDRRMTSMGHRTKWR